MPPKRKSVAESVEHLLKAKCLVQSDSEDETQVKLSESLSNVDQKRRSSGILSKKIPFLHEIDKKYKGTPASRRDNDDLDDSEGGNDEDSESDDEDQDIDSGINDFIKQFKSKVQEDVDEEDDDDQEEDEDDEDTDGDDGEEDGKAGEEENASSEGGSEDEDSDGMEDESEADIESEPAMKILLPNQDNPVRKGQAVRTQLDLWERILETRIKIQPVLNKANGFPSADQFDNLQKSSNEFKDLAQETQNNVAHLLDNLIDLQNTLINQFIETKSIFKQGLYKRKFQEEMDQNVPDKLSLEFHAGKEGTFKSYSSSVIQKWSDRTKVTNARSSKELQLNHSVLNQIEAILLNKPDLIKSSQTIKGTFTLFGQDKEEQEDRDKWCPEVYDDTDFYHQMLRELIEYKSNSSSNPTEAAKNYSELQKLKSKIKKQVDQKASKGRKIRYVVHKKLVNFMAPYSDSKWTDEAVKELFTSLFGNYHKTENDGESAPIENERTDDTQLKIM